MNHDDLSSLASGGFSAIPGDMCGEIAQWALDYAEQTGDARYSSIGIALEDLSTWWYRHDESGGIPIAVKDSIESVIRSKLPQILEAESSSDAAPLARVFREDIQALLTEPGDWVRLGYLSRA